VVHAQYWYCSSADKTQTSKCVSGYTTRGCECFWVERTTRSPSLHTLKKGHAGRDVGECIVQALPTDACPIFRFEIAFGLNFVRVQNMEKARSIAAAAGIFQQECVAKFSLLVDAHAHLLRQSHPDHAGADRVAHRLPFGKIRTESGTPIDAAGHRGCEKEK